MNLRFEMQTVTVCAPGPWATTNQRHHWTVRNRITQAWRSAAAWHARADRIRPVAGPVRIEATIRRADSRRFDLDGHAPTVKACIDGLRDAGVLIEDDMRHMPTLTLTAGPKTPLGCVVLTIRPNQMTTPTEGDPR